jgi:cell division protein FtsI (penicillin-binding protein 3)
MSPRSDDTPRRGNQPRRGTSRDLPADDSGAEETGENGRGRGFGIGDARAYTPRGRTMAERDQRTRSPRAGRTADPFRPALQVLDGGRQAPRKGRAGEPQDGGARAARERAVRGSLAKDAGRPHVGRQRDGDDHPGGAGRERRGQSGRTGNKAAQSRRTVTGPRVSRAVRAVAPEPPKLANSTRRLRLGTVVALALFTMIGIRLVTLQVAASPGELAKMLTLQKNRTTDVTLIAPRGSILDRNGAVLTHSVEARLITVDPELVTDADKEAAVLAPLIARPVSEIVPLMRKHQRWPGGPQSQYEFLKHGVDISMGRRIAAMKLDGIVVSKDERRDYPGADLAANIVGFVGGNNEGAAGIEGKYDQLLRGTPGKHVYEHGLGSELDSPIPGGYDRYTAPNPGTSVQLTIDEDLQFETQRILREQNEAKKATIGGAVVMDVKTGEVLAQASFPPYNAAKAGDYSPGDRQDVPSGIVADPGSVHKAFVFGAALQEGVITPDTVIEIGPAIDVGGVAFADSHQQPKGTKMTMAGILALSSNVGTILVSRKLGPQKLYEYQQKFGLGRAVKEGVAGEVPGKIIPPDEWSGSGYGSIPIGMSVDATLVQMAGGYAAIANDGTYVQPHIVKSFISGQDGKVSPASKPETHTVLSPEVAKQLRAMMEGVITGDHATGTQAAVPGYRVAGKTGTGKRLVDGKYNSYNYDTFIGMAPAENPRYVVAVSADVPKGSAGDVVAPAFSQMMSYTLQHYGVPPSTTPPPTLKIHP